MGSKKKDIEYLTRENERVREDFERMKKINKYLITKIGIGDSEKEILKDLLNRW